MFEEQVAWAPVVWAATLALIVVTIEYLVLVPLTTNRGAKRLAFLLIAASVMSCLTLARIYLGDWEWRYEVLSGWFGILTLCVLYLGWNIYTDQVEGARRFREQSRNHNSDQE